MAVATRKITTFLASLIQQQLSRKLATQRMKVMTTIYLTQGLLTNYLNQKLPTFVDIATEKLTRNGLKTINLNFFYTLQQLTSAG